MSRSLNLLNMDIEELKVFHLLLRYYANWTEYLSLCGKGVEPMRMLRLKLGIRTKTLYEYQKNLVDNGYLTIKNARGKITKTGRYKELTKDGILLLLRVDNMLKAYEQKKVIFKIDVGPSTESYIELKAPNLLELETLEIMTSPNISSSVLELLYYLLKDASRYILPFDITIHRDMLPFQSDVLKLIHYLMNLHDVTISKSLPIGIYDKYGQEAPLHWSENIRYVKLWEYYEQKILSHTSKHKVDVDYLTQYFPSLVMERKHVSPIELVNNSDVRKWLGIRLKQNSDFIVPKIFWKHLGFKERELGPQLGVECFTSSMLINPNHLQFKIIRLKQILSTIFIFESEKAKLEYLINWMSQHRIQRDPDFYESWKILRLKGLSYGLEISLDMGLTYDSSIPNISKILDEAVLKYIFTDYTPSVDIVEALKDLQKGKNISDILLGIRNNEYNIDLTKYIGWRDFGKLSKMW